MSYVDDSGERSKTSERLRLCLRAHPLLGTDEAIVQEVELCTELIQLGFDDVLIGVGRQDSDLYLIFSGIVDIIVDGEQVAQRAKGETVGELEMVCPQLKRVATVVARDKTMVGRISEPAFTALAERFPVLWRNIAAELVKPLTRKTTPQETVEKLRDDARDLLNGLARREAGVNRDS